jgi:phage tail-like protein
MDDQNTQDAIWPLPSFYFSAQLGPGLTSQFQEVNGMEEEAPVYRHETVPSPTPARTPAVSQGNVTLRKGIFVNDTKFWTWYNEIKMNIVARRTITISLLDEAGKPKTTWTLNNAFPTKINTPDLKTEGNEVAVESLEIAYETLVVSAP